MKAFVLSFFVAIISSAAIASVDANSSWAEINRLPFMIPKAPTVYMGRSIDYMFVCQNGSRLQTMKPVDITETRSRGHRDEVVVVGREVLSTPIHYSQMQEDCVYRGHADRLVCHKHLVSGYYPLTVSVPVYQQLSPKRTVYRFTKIYTVPQCDGSEPTPN